MILGALVLYESYAVPSYQTGLSATTQAPRLASDGCRSGSLCTGIPFRLYHYTSSFWAQLRFIALLSLDNKSSAKIKS